MFENKITSTKFSGTLADCMFRRINGQACDNDVTFISTLRALLMNRIPKENTIKFEYHSLAMGDHTKQELEAYLNIPDSIILLNLRTNPFENETDIFESIEFPETYHEFIDVRTFFAEKMDCRAAINEEIRSSIVIIVDASCRRQHLIQCIIPKLLPWFFGNNRITVQEKNLLFSLREKQSNAYEAALEFFNNTDDFRSRSIGAALTTLKLNNLNAAKRTAERAIAEINTKIDNMNNDILRLLRELNTENFKLNGVLAALNSDEQDTDDTLTTFLSGNRNIDVLDCGENRLTIAIKGYLDVYDPEAYQPLARNINSWYWTMWREVSNRIFERRDVRKKVLDAIFGDDPVFKLKTVGVFHIDMLNNTINVGSSGDLYNNYSNTHYPNPHLYYNACLGAHRSPINRALNQGDIIGAISQCVSSVHSVNVTESASFRHVCTDLFKSTAPVLEGPEGKLFTTEQAYQYLLDHETTI